MVKVDVISGFLGAGKTTLIKKLFESKIANEQVVIIENEFGEIGIDGSFLKESGVQIKEINSGCICCSLVGDFATSIKEVISKFNPDRIIIEPSGVGKLSDIVNAISNVDAPLELNIVVTVVDGGKCKMYIKNFGEFYVDQVKQAHNVVVSRADKLTDEKIQSAVALIKEINPKCSVITTPLSELNGEKLVETLENGGHELEQLIEQLKSEHSHHHHHHEDEEECCCGHHHHDHEHHHHEDGECCHHEHHHEDGEECHHHHDEDDECCCHHHENEEEHHHHHEEGECCCHHEHDHDDEHHHHDDEEECHHHHHHHEDEECCHGHHHHHDGHHHADEVFSSWGMESVRGYTKEELSAILDKLCDETYGIILRAKGIVKANDNKEWYYFDLVYGDYEIRTGSPDVIGKVCVIGSKINEKLIEELFNK